VFWDQGKYKAAEEMNRRALSGREKILGPGHPDTLVSFNSVGTAGPGQVQDGGRDEPTSSGRKGEGSRA